MLVSYDSSPEPEAAASAPSTSKAVLPAVAQTQAEEGLESDEEVEFDPTDAFGLKQAPTVAQKSAASGKAVVVASAPDVMVLTSNNAPGSTSLVTRPSDSVIFFNPTYDDMGRAVEGPVNPWSDRKLEKMNTITGHVEQQAFSDLTFKEQQRSFQVLGYASNPSILSTSATGPGMVGDIHQAYLNGGNLVSDLVISRAKTKATKRKRKGKGTLGEFEDEDEEEEEAAPIEDGAVGEDGEPIIAPLPKKKENIQKEYLGPWAGWEDEDLSPAVPTAEQWEEQEENGGAPLNKKQRKQVVVDDKSKLEVGFGQEKSVFHGKDLHDYLGRSYLHVPTDVEVNLSPSEPGLQECFQPKKCIHTWNGHTKGVSKIQLFPKSGHLLLSGALDNRIKLWDVYHEGKCLRTFMGHSKGVRDVTFNNDGTRFLSSSFDRQMKLWDTETGQCIQAFSNKATPGPIKFHPEKQNVFLAGMSDKKILQFDIGSGEITQEYDQHLGAINTINFVDENRRFVSTSDDKTIRVWDYDIPVVIKYIAEPTMHSMPAVGMHPTGKWMAMQSLDNQILIFGADSFKQNRKKRFAGHTVAGYACEPQFSPDGRFVSSGDGQGNMVFWDWKTCRITSRFKAHSKVVISSCWLPHETSKLVTSSWDGLIKLWD